MKHLRVVDTNGKGTEKRSADWNRSGDFRSRGPNQDHQKALGLIFVLFMALLYKQVYWDAYFHPQAPLPQQGAAAGVPQPERKPTAAAPESFEEPEEIGNAPAAKSPQSEALPAPGVVPQGYPTDGQLRSAGVLTIETPRYRAELSLLGGRLMSFHLLDYKESLDDPSKKLEMVEHIERAPLPLGVYSGSGTDTWTRYEVVTGPPRDSSGFPPVRLEKEATSDLVLQGQLSDGRTVKKTLHFAGEGYLVGVDLNVSGPPADGSKLNLEWTKLIPKDSPQLLDPYQETSYVWFDGQKAFRESLGKMHSDTIDLPEVRWVSLSDKYFMASLLSPEAAASAKVMKTGQLYRGRLSGGETELRSRVFIGPKNLSLLQGIGFEMSRNINFGRWTVIAAPLASLLHSLSLVLGNYGLAIVVLTIIVKLCLYPLTASSFRQMKAMQDLAPEMQKIKESVTDKQQQQLAMMELYKKNNVNPLGGCLPMLLQMPVFFGLFSALQLSIELRHAPFTGWIHDLSAPEKLMLGHVAVPVMVILFVLSMLVQQWTTPSNMDPTQKKVMMVMPLVFGVMFASMPAGLTLYWLTNNTISICQQQGLRSRSSASAFGITAGSALGVFCLAFILVKLFGH